jgi:hypothetical protein
MFLLVVQSLSADVIFKYVSDLTYKCFVIYINIAGKRYLVNGICILNRYKIENFSRYSIGVNPVSSLNAL